MNANDNMEKGRLEDLIRKYLSNEASEKEKEEVESWYDSFDSRKMELDQEVDKSSFYRSWVEVKKGREGLHDGREKRLNIKVLYRWVAAAILLLLVSYVFLYRINYDTPPKEAAGEQQAIKKDFKPGGNKAILTLGNGKKVVLDSSAIGLLSVQGNMKVVKLKNGQLSYKVKGEDSGEVSTASGHKEIAYNTITTPRGGQYEITLVDGSKVWLNAASSLRFPTRFVGNKRKVEMTGEAYFEIAAEAESPFVVKKGKTEVKVLGTHFNVMAYPDASDTKVTLLEGKVKVDQRDAGYAQILKPNEQAKIKRNGRIEIEKGIDVKSVIAWKNNLFWFEDDDIQNVARQLSRWYDVDIKIKGKITDLFTGSISKNLTFSQVFEVLQRTGRVHYKIENEKEITIMP